jgi:hypothetical protein
MRILLLDLPILSAPSLNSITLLHSPLLLPHRPHHINLISDSVGASKATFDSKVDPEANKMNLLIAELAAMKE